MMRGANERQNFFTNYTRTILKAYIFRSKDHVHSLKIRWKCLGHTSFWKPEWSKINWNKKLKRSQLRLDTSFFHGSLLRPFLWQSNFLINQASLAFNTNGSLFITFSTASPWMWWNEWPGWQKCSPLGSSVLWNLA